MGILYVMVGLLLAFVVASIEVPDRASLTLSFVQVITRHGARTPFASMPPSQLATWYCWLFPFALTNEGGDVDEVAAPDRLYRKLYIRNREPLPGNCSEGQLTDIGGYMHYLLGLQFRDKYITEFPLVNSIDDVYVRSTDVDRTIISAQNLLIGMFPHLHQSKDKTHYGASYLPVKDIFVVEQTVEDMVPNDRCPALMAQCNAVQNTTTWLNKLDSMTEIGSTLMNAWNVTSLPEWFVLNDEFYSRYYHDIKQPVGVTNDIIETVFNLSSWQMGQIYGTRERVRYAVGPFLLELYNQLMSAMSSNYKGPKFALYSSHDTGIANIAMAFDIWTGNWPGYASNIAIELLLDKATNEYYISICYTDAPPATRSKPSAVIETVPWKKFVSMISDVMVDANTWAAECQTDSPESPVDSLSNFLC